jgi:bifunctional UDP-N-acetylglucosamine pyrophosphorylase/glucosamine-1-phosphate N-acetyltransferase
MHNGVTLLDPSRLDVRGSLSAGLDVVIDINCLFEGRVVLGNDVSIGPNCHIRDAVIGDGCHIKANSVIEQAVLQENCDIGPFARLRPGTELAAGVKVGNFVETKQARIGEGSKVSHLSYVGDAKIGSGVNVGAGTITCNYDGVNKFQTEIGDGAFIGSNSALVAPVKVGAGATVGAGSTITKDVADDQLSVARGKQRNLENWQRPVKQKD